MRERLVDSGAWSKEQGEFFMREYPHYSPTKILAKLDPERLKVMPNGSMSFSVGSDGVKKLTTEGTTAERMSPTQAIIQMTFDAEKLAQRNQIMRAVAGWADQPGMEHFVRKLKGEEAAPLGWKAVDAFIDGKKQRLAVLEEMEKTLSLENPGITGLYGAILNGLRMPLQFGATAGRPAFIFTNALNDALLTLFRFTTQAPSTLEGLRSVSDLYRGYHMAFGTAKPATRAAVGAITSGGTTAVAVDPDDPNYWAKVVGAAGAGAAAGLSVRASAKERAAIQRMREAGGSIGIQSRFSNPADIVRQLAGEHVWVRTATTEKDIKSILKSKAQRFSDIAGLFWSRPLAQVGQIVESAPRYAAFTRAERQGLSQTEAAQAARRVTVDFSAGGLFTKMLNSVMPFLNASMQAAVEGGDMLQKNP